nr:glycosyltransferase family 9 protein [uncultured Anaeromusa sp.]
MKKIFVSKQQGIGDVVLATPVLEAIKKRFPKCELTLMTFPNAVQAVAGLSFIDHVFSYDKKKDSSWTVLKEMHGSDAAIFLDLQYRPPMLAALARVPIRAGLSHKRAFWLTHQQPWSEWMDHTYEPEVNRRILNELLGWGLPSLENARPSIGHPAERERQIAEKLLRDAGVQGAYIISSPRTAFFLKDWELNKWEQLYELILNKWGIPIIVVGNSEVSFATKKLGVVDLTGKTNLSQMIHLISNAKLLINSCSLPVHIAAAAEVPSVVLYGYGDSERWAPRKRCQVVNAGLPCSPCDGYIGSTCLDPLCMKAIQVEDVWRACELIAREVQL